MTISNSAVQELGTCVAFDFDGTITTTDSLRDFVRYQVGNRRFLIGGLLVLPWLVGMATGLCERAEAKARFLAVTLRGRTQVELEAAAARYAAERLPTLIRPEMLERIEEHKRLGHRLVLVSASPTLYLGHWAQAAGFDAVLATQLEFRDGRFTGRLASPNCWGPEKVRQLQQWLGDARGRVLFAYGDSRGDQEMLAFAEHGWLRGLSALPSLDAWPDGLHHG
ncbi:HAD family hydrolase [Pseudomonas gingeri]|uniref:HAD family hydrolase n=1 Tax=Pseudomonas gingeri TaxID=117681 RepID=A0A7Y7XBA8_9PSED|nr:HAD family hydrolase [Pseudomonas gingeri]NWA24808.1 HAD family hydrolase [Pseudomonas gingeri]NWB96581.1 HAD family hydrolase [Pseudomonas gingeri]NWD71639.1 HAD family hydrolase [Pseudomonas gingeri]